MEAEWDTRLEVVQAELAAAAAASEADAAAAAEALGDALVEQQAGVTWRSATAVWPSRRR